jgi:hypothetical protein
VGVGAWERWSVETGKTGKTGGCFTENKQINQKMPKCTGFKHHFISLIYSKLRGFKRNVSK